jgi:2-polyprenyl-3-methyl-5-hydroxy-6-metoxy-1,4-benzoquinol methylase
MDPQHSAYDARMESTDDAVERIRAHFDDGVEAEWLRLEQTPAGRVSFEIHRRFAARHVRPGMSVLEVGAGPGRFTRVLAELGTRVTVTDLSARQLQANEQRARDEGYASAIASWDVLDVRDTRRFAAAQFDVVLSYGGPLSYVFDHAEEALRGLLRITAPEGVVLGSVMSLLGAWRHFLPAVLELSDEDNDHILATGDLRRSQPDGHVAQMYRARDLRALIGAAGATPLALSASNWASLDHPDALAALAQSPGRWQRFLDHEEAACAEPGALDGGTHLLFACR